MYRDKEKQKSTQLRYYYRQKTGNYCPDCGTNVSRKGKRCPSCANQVKRSEYSKSLGVGRVINVHGYIMIKINGKYAPESRYIWEQYYNKSIPKGWQIHHLDGDKTNNVIENLYACSKHDHMSLNFNKALQRRILGLQEEIKLLKDNVSHCLL